jgi:hypothetical protein
LVALSKAEAAPELFDWQKRTLVVLSAGLGFGKKKANRDIGTPVTKFIRSARVSANPGGLASYSLVNIGAVVSITRFARSFHSTGAALLAADVADEPPVDDAADVAVDASVDVDVLTLMVTPAECA